MTYADELIRAASLFSSIWPIDDDNSEQGSSPDKGNNNVYITR